MPKKSSERFFWFQICRGRADEVLNPDLKIKDTCYKQILETYQKEKHKKVNNRKLVKFVCDKFANYKSAFNKLFRLVAKLEFGVPIACKKYNFEHNNNSIERSKNSCV